MKSEVEKTSNGVYTTAIFAICLIIGGLTSLRLGQDANWDLLNYHLYDAWAFFHHGLSQDYFPASIQSYFPPYLDLPYYILSTKLIPNHPKLIAFAMGVPYGILIFVVFLINWRILSVKQESSSTEKVILCILSTAFGVSGSATITQVGTTFNEIQTAALSLIGVLLLLMSSSRPSHVDIDKQRATQLTYIFYSGLMFGLAAGLKLTAIIYGAGGGFAVLSLCGRPLKRLQRVVVFSGGWIIAYLISCGYWDLELYKETGNPFFPLFNGIFRSTWAPEQNFSDGRFFPHGMVEMLFYPFFWMQKSAITVIESPFVDPRFAIVFSLTAVIGLTFLFLWIKRGRPKGDVIDLEQIDIILIFSFTSFYIWETLFSILRYLIEVEALLGVFMLCVALRSTVSLGVRISYRLCSVFMAFLLLVVSIVTVYPQMGRVKFSKNEFEITHSQLPHHSLVILAGVPIGYLVPFLVGDDSASRVIGMNDTIGLSQQTGLGAIISHEISTWTGPIFVVARHDTLISASQLSSYHLFPMGNCSIIHENIDSENFICPLTLSPNTNKWPSVGSTP